MRIGNKYIGGDKPCFIVAEAGLAHGGNKDKAFELIDVAVKGGADAVKFQMYRAKELIDHTRDYDLYERYKRKELGDDTFIKLKSYAEGKGIIWFAAPHTEGALEDLRRMGVELYKVGSGEKGSDLIGKVLAANKPTFISTGMRTHSQVMDMVERFGDKRVCFLHCVTMYPVHPHLANIGFLRLLGAACGQVGSLVGYSCHMAGTMGIEAAVAMGAKVIEKHIKLEDTEGQDVLGALDAEEFRVMVKKVRMIESILGEERRIYSGEERGSERWALKGKDGKRPL